MSAHEPPEDRVEKTPALRVGVACRRAADLDERARNAEIGGVASSRLRDDDRIEEPALRRGLPPDDFIRRDSIREELPRRRAPALERRLDDDVSHMRDAIAVLCSTLSTW